MSRYGKRRRNYKSEKMTKEDEFQWLFFIAIFSVFFVGYFTWGFLTNCVFEWPIRWDVGTCWNEQGKPAQDKAMEKVIDFTPSKLRI